MSFRSSYTANRLLRAANVSRSLRRPAPARRQHNGSSVFLYRWSGLAVGGISALGLATGYLLLGGHDEPMHRSGSSPFSISYEEVRKHNTRESCWVIIDGHVYDVTSLLDTHPGGAAAILKNAGADATKTFRSVHGTGFTSRLPPEAYIGPIDLSIIPTNKDILSQDEVYDAEIRAKLPPPYAVINLREIEDLAKSVLSQTAWAYYSSTGDDGHSHRENQASFSRFWFRPRVLNKVSKVETETTILSCPSSLPIFIAPAALARLGHPDGELNLVRAAGKEGILQGISNNASCTLDEIATAKHANQNLFFQLYMNKDRAASESLIKRVENSGFKAIILTVDAPVPGKRELDQRTQLDEVKGLLPTDKSTGGSGVSHAISSYQDPDVCWEDIKWMKSLTKLPIVVKGISCVEDAEKAFKHGVDAIVLSNHGGRELDYAPAPMTVLHELHLKRPDLLKKHEVYIDGGVTRGTDVIKALCLGARAVGLGRAFLYANGIWGEEGCRRVIEIMREEIETGMRLLGVTSVDELTPDLIRFVDRSG